LHVLIFLGDAKVVVLFCFISQKFHNDFPTLIPLTYC